MQFVVIIESNDGGSGHVCEGKQATAELVRAQLNAPDSNDEGLIGGEVERMERGLAEFLEARNDHPARIWWVKGCDRWKEVATIVELTETAS